jgi:ATP-dependent RNA helicase DeaD
MLKDTLFAEETTPEDLVLARAMLAERSPEDIAAALARLYRARLPSPEDILDAGHGGGRSRDIGGRDRERGPSRENDRAAGPRPKPGKSSPRHAMAEGSVWFRAAIGRKKNAEARWLLPMICRRGGIDKHDIGAIRIMDTTTEFEISQRVVDSFTAMIRRPDKEDNIRIELLGDAPQGESPQSQSPQEKRPHAPRRESEETDRRPRQNDPSRDERKPKHFAKPHDRKPYEGKPRDDKPRDDRPRDSKPHAESRARFDKDADHKKKRPPHKPAYDGLSQYVNASPAKPGFGKKAKKKHRG